MIYNNIKFAIKSEEEAIRIHELLGTMKFRKKIILEKPVAAEIKDGNYVETQDQNIFKRWGSKEVSSESFK